LGFYEGVNPTISEDVDTPIFHQRNNVFWRNKLKELKDDWKVFERKGQMKC